MYYKLQSFVLMPIFGLTNGMLPIVAYNYGAKQRERILQTVKLAAGYAFAIMLLGLLLFQLLAPTLLRVFEPQDAAGDFLQIGSTALRIISISFPVSALTLVFASFFQAVGSGVLSLTLSLSRQLIFLLPLALLLSSLGGLGAIWWAFLLAEALGLALAGALLARTYRHKILTLGAEPQQA